MAKIPVVLTIAGSDSGGGAGIQADLKTFSANRVYGASVLTALTAQNTQGVDAVHDVPVEFIASQMKSVFSDMDVAAVKIGMLSNADVIETVAQELNEHNARNIVLDPVMVATSGDVLLAEAAIEALKSELIPRAMIITPNLHEAAKLTGRELAKDEQEMVAQAEMLLEQGANAVLMKGGHSDASEAADLLATHVDKLWVRAPWIKTKNTHGTGCSLSSAIAAHLALGLALAQAIEAAKQWLSGAIARADDLQVGKGSGPVHHFYELWKD